MSIITKNIQGVLDLSAILLSCAAILGAFRVLYDVTRVF